MAKVVDDPVVQFKLLEPATGVLPSDARELLPDMDAGSTNVRPPVVAGATGPARAFDGATPTGLETADSALLLRLTRSVTAQAVVRLDVAAQDALATPGTLCALGFRDASPGEDLQFSIELEVDNLATRLVTARMLWEDSAGAVKNGAGGVQFIWPTDGAGGFGVVIFTAVREWLGVGNVVVRYYANDLFLGRDNSTDGDISGAVGALFSMGVRGDGAGGYENYLEGTIESLALFDYVMTAEEIRQITRTLFVHAPAQYESLKTLLPKDVWSNDPESIFQRELVGEAQMFGDAISKAFEIRDDFLPDRAWSFLDRWETVLGLIPGPSDTLTDRRNRILSNLRTIEGFSVPGIKAALEAPFNLDASQIEICENTHLLTDDFATALASYWEQNPGDHAIAITAGELDFTLTPASEHKYETLDAGGDGPAPPFVSVHVDDDEDLELCIRVASAALVVDDETFVGVVMRNGIGALDNSLLFWGAFRTGGVLTLGTMTIVDGVQSAVSSFGAAPATPFFLHVKDLGSSYELSTAPGISQFDRTLVTTASGPGTVGTVQHVLVGSFGLVLGGPTGADAVTFDDFEMNTPQGDRVYFWYAYRDPSLPGTFDIPGANDVVNRIKPAHTTAAAVTIKALICDDPGSLCDDGPLTGSCD